MSRRPVNPAAGFARTAALEPGPVDQSKLSLGGRIVHQLTCSWFRKLVVGAFPFIAYGSWTFIDHQITRYNYRLQQAAFFKQSLACIANTPEVREKYGRGISLKRASIWTVTSGFVPWIKERHVWLGFSGKEVDGWIRMGLRKTDFVLDKEGYKALQTSIRAELQPQRYGAEVENGDDDVVSDEVIKSTDEVTKSSEEVTKSTDEVTKSSEEVIKSTEEVIKSTEEVIKSTEEVTKSSDEVTKSTEEVTKSTEEVTKSTEEVTKSTEQMNREAMSQKLDEKAVRDKLAAEKNEKFRSEMQRLYPTLPDCFSQNDLDQALEIKLDRELDGRVFDQTWDLLSLSIHPDENSRTGDGEVLVLYDPDKSYVDQGDYLIDTAWFSIKKPQSMRSTAVQRVGG